MNVVSRTRVPFDDSPCRQIPPLGEILSHEVPPGIHSCSRLVSREVWLVCYDGPLICRPLIADAMPHSRLVLFAVVITAVTSTTLLGRESDISIRSLSVQPQAIQLSSVNPRQQLLVTGIGSNDRAIDITSFVQIRAENHVYQPESSNK